MRRSSRRTFFRPKCTSVWIDNKASKPIISSYLIPAIDQIFWFFGFSCLQPFFVASQMKTVSLLSICFARMIWFCVFLEQNNFYKWRPCFPRLMVVPRSQHSDVSFKGANDSIIEQNIRVFFSFAFLVCVCVFAVARKSGQRVVHFYVPLCICGRCSDVLPKVTKSIIIEM